MIMKNILSYKSGTLFYGKEIKEWIRYQIENETSHYKEAVNMQRCDVLDEARYYIDKGNYQASARHFLITREK